MTTPTLGVTADRLISNDDAVDLDLDRVDVTLPCGHTIRVHRDRAGGTTTCGSCYYHTGKWVTHTLDFTPPPPRDGYRPRTKRGHPTTWPTLHGVEAAPAHAPDLRTHTQRLADGGRELARLDAAAARRLAAARAYIAATIADRGGAWLTRNEYDQSRGHHPRSQQLIRNSGLTWTQLVRQAGATDRPPNGADNKRRGERLHETEQALHSMARTLGRVPTHGEWIRDRPPHAYGIRAIRDATGHTWSEWVRSLGYQPRATGHVLRP